ncbi:uncharacterized protein ACOB8E_006181 isoform 2-T2 [Sarcophilus harrisii]
MDSDDGQMEHESINPLHSEENSDILVTKSVSEGNVVVQPEPKKKEDKDDYQEPEVGHKSKMETKTSKRHVGSQLPQGKALYCGLGLRACAEICAFTLGLRLSLEPNFSPRLRRSPPGPGTNLFWRDCRFSSADHHMSPDYKSCEQWQSLKCVAVVQGIIRGRKLQMQSIFTKKIPWKENSWKTGKHFRKSNFPYKENTEYCLREDREYRKTSQTVVLDNLKRSQERFSLQGRRMEQIILHQSGKEEELLQ